MGGITVEYNFASRVERMESSIIREILKVTEQPGIISFAGGLPAPEMFPLQEIKQNFDKVLGEGDESALQYSATEGFYPLREYIAAALAEIGINTSPDQVLITNGSQQAIDLVAKLFLDPGDVVLVESPSYLGALQVFNSYQASLVAVPTDPEGIELDSLERALTQYKPKLIYITPTFKNPTGETMGLERREALAAILARHHIPLVEDDPYRELRYSGTPVPPIKAFDKDGKVIYLGTFSKTVAPGLRLGFAITSAQLMPKMVLAKQGADLHTGTLVQRALFNYLTSSNVKGHINAICKEYAIRRDTMISAMKRQFPEGVKWTEPQGGMFLWITLPPQLDTTSLLNEAIKLGIAYVPGPAFFPTGGGQNCLRLNFSNSSPDQIETGISRLARLFHNSLG
ncbi:hypothetical protein N752_15805 [Desulforamulus aquiferis]|nr:PLP-dependent aminotransferase family protein [Desulforamulus aquiferis]RYD04307.1 hypothetical protein N752_15805 [Desulforamulus aquiferis]